MPDGGSTGMDTDATHDLGIAFEDLSKVLDEVGKAAAPDGPERWTPEHFGGLEAAQDAANTLLQVLTSLGNSVGYVVTTTDGIAAALTGVAASTQDVEDSNTQTVNAADGT